ncbi:MAG: baseplate J/gp47 family protein [Aestuariivirga sp.]
MPDEQQARIARSRDGTGQPARLLPELDPDYVRVDERTTRDLLAFAAEYARELKYFGPDDNEQGDWTGFIDPRQGGGMMGAAHLDAAASYAAEPEKFSEEKSVLFSRPHFALFLAFLRLLDSTRSQLNTLTRRHLEFFYRDVLKMIRKPAVPDQVHVLVDLDSGTDELALPAGTALRAGKDSLGRELTYRTGRELIANQIEVAQISSLHADIEVIGIREASRQNLKHGTRSEAFVYMLRIALGQPDPGDPLPIDLTANPPLYPGVPPANQANPEVGFDALVQAGRLIAVVETGLGMPSFDDFRDLMNLRRLRKDGETANWIDINAFLVKTGKRHDQNFRINPKDSNAFEANVEAALDKRLDGLFDGLAEVDTMEEAYAAYVNRPREVEDFLKQALAPMLLDEFKAMMQIKVLMDNQWDQINRLVEEAGKHKNAKFTLSPEARASRNFDFKFTAAGLTFSGPGFVFSGSFDKYVDAFLSVERYFHMSAENYKYLVSLAPQGDAPAADEWAWDKAYEIVAAAHSEMIFARRRNALLRAAHPGNAPITDNVKALRDMLAVVLNEIVSPGELRQKLDALEVADRDRTYLVGIAEQREPSPDWAAVAKVLEIAQRNRENFKAPLAEKVEWRYLYPAGDATAVKVRPGAEVQPRWKTFGQGQQAREPVPQVSFGWAMASPLLVLGEGTRTVELTLGFSADPLDFDLAKILKLLNPPASTPLVAGFNPFLVEVSTDKGWLEPASSKLFWANDKMLGYPEVPGVNTADLHALSLSFTLAKGQPALAPATRGVHGIDSPEPVLRLMMKPVWNEQEKCYITGYQVLRNLVLIRARLMVSVNGLERLSLHNDQSLLDPQKPFEPFGIAPAAGSRLYIGHREIVAKRLDSLSFHIAWMGVPSNLATHYANYPGSLANASFNTKVALSDAGVLKDFSAPLPLFDTGDAAKPVAVKLTPPADQGNPDNAVADSTDVTEWNRYVVWELNSPDFQHAAYPNVALQKSLEMAAAIANKTPATLVAATYQVNPPYTPKIKSLSLDYTASAEVALEPTAAASTMRVFHVQPFGYNELKAEGAQPGCAFLPRYDFEGELHIGLRNVVAPQNVSLLFQVAEGSANPDLAPEPVRWSYLSGNRWLTLQDGSLLADATRGLINSGIIELSLKPAQPSTLLPEGLYWIRAAIARSSESVCDMVAIHPNAALATFDDDDNAADHLSVPLPPESIGGPVTPIGGVARVRQPYTSFGGKMAEQDASFYVRVSERLRHKRRALTAWDYERLVLEKFPRIYKVKCLRADPLAHPRDPGRVELVVIPDIRNRLQFDPFEPKAPADLIRDIETFLQDKIPPFASVKVKNAHYVSLKVRCGVRFVAGADVGFYRRRLIEELNRFLSPWAYEEGADLVIGGSIYANSIIDFIDRRDYVDYIAEFKLFTSEDGENFVFIPPPGATAQAEGYHASAARPDAILVASRQHEIDLIVDAGYQAEDFTGINYMRIELDFIVG